MRSSLSSSTSSRFTSQKWIQTRQKAGGGQELIIENISDIFREVERKPCNLISIFGRARQGKSFLMNVLSGESEIFRISNEKESCTQGIDISNKWLSVTDFSRIDRATIVKSDNQVGFVDAEGQGDKDVKYDATLVCPILLASKCVIFNWKGDLQKEHLLQTLALMSKAAENVRVESESSAAGGSSGVKKFGHLHICFRDWQSINTNSLEVKSQLFKEERTTGSEERDKIRRDLQACFQTITVWLFDAPVDKAEMLKQKLKLENCTENFKSQVRQFRKELSIQLSDASFMGGRPLNGRDMARYVNEIAVCLNQGNVVLPQSAYSGMIKQELDNLFKLTLENLDSDIDKYIAKISEFAHNIDTYEFFPNESEAKKQFDVYFSTFVGEFNGELDIAIGDAPESMTKEITKDIPHSDAKMEALKDTRMRLFLNQFRSELHVFFSGFQREGEKELKDVIEFLQSDTSSVDYCESFKQIEEAIWDHLYHKLYKSYEAKWSQSEQWKDIFKSWGTIISLGSQNIFRTVQQNSEKLKLVAEQIRRQSEKVLNDSKEELARCLPVVLKELDKRNPTGFKIDVAMGEMNKRYGDMKLKLRADLAHIKCSGSDVEGALNAFKQHGKEICSNVHEVYDAALITKLGKVAEDLLSEISKVSSSISLRNLATYLPASSSKVNFLKLSFEDFQALLDDKFFQDQYMKLVEVQKKKIAGWDNPESFWKDIEERHILESAQTDFGACKERVLDEFSTEQERLRPPPAPSPSPKVEKSTSSSSVSSGIKRPRAESVAKVVEVDDSNLTAFERAKKHMKAKENIDYDALKSKRPRSAAVSLNKNASLSGNFVRQEHEKTRRSIQASVKMQFDDDEDDRPAAKSTPLKPARGSIQASLASRRAAAAPSASSTASNSRRKSVSTSQDPDFQFIEDRMDEGRNAPTRRPMTQEELRREMQQKKAGGK